MVNETVSNVLNPEGFEQAFALYEVLGVPVASMVLLPLLTILVYGFILGENKRQNFWLLLISAVAVAIVTVAAFPVSLMYI